MSLLVIDNRVKFFTIEKLFWDCLIVHAFIDLVTTIMTTTMLKV